MDSAARLAGYRKRVYHPVAERRGRALVRHAFSDQDQVNRAFWDLESVGKNRRHVARIPCSCEFYRLLPDELADRREWKPGAAMLTGIVGWFSSRLHPFERRASIGTRATVLSF